jgi:formate hydrogenlyase transcriptional activator
MTTVTIVRETELPLPVSREVVKSDRAGPLNGNSNGEDVEAGHGRSRGSRRLNGTNSEIIGRSAALRAVLRQVEIVAPTGATVLIEGETGTGKELIARALHDLSPRYDRPLAKINCAAIPAGLLESELFGYERGAFTGAVARKAGRFEVAHQGTLFLDEVADFPPELQPKLLRVLQEKEFERLGSNQTQKTNVRLVAATSRNLAQMVADRQFRNDLYYRLNVFPIRMPALRERLEDIPLLVQHFVNKYAGQMHKEIDSVAPGVMDSFKNYNWPGNIRELENYIERSVILSPGNVLRPPMTELEQPPRPPSNSIPGEQSKSTTLEECEREHILRALNETRWLVGGPSGAATRLGVKRTTLIWKMKKLGIKRKRSLSEAASSQQQLFL